MIVGKTTTAKNDLLIGDQLIVFALLTSFLKPLSKTIKAAPKGAKSPQELA
jgi:hypothetical protein